MRTITCFGDRTSGAFLIIASVSRTKRKRIKKIKKSLILHGWESREQKKINEYENGNNYLLGDRTSSAFLIIASVSQTKARSHGPITL